MKQLSVRTVLLATTALLVLTFIGPSNQAAEEPCELPGDVNDCGMYDAMDIVFLVDWLWNSGPAPPIMAQADANCDCVVDAMDLLYILEDMWMWGPDPCNACNLLCWDDDCCVVRGDLDGDGDADADDLAWWNEWIPPLPGGEDCDAVKDVDGSGFSDGMDLVYFIDYIFNGGPPPVPCP